MKKRIISLVLVLILVVSFAASCKKSGGDEIVLTMGSWRADDVAQIEALLAEYKRVSGVTVKFEPTNPPDYNTTLRLQLESGTGPDLMYARSWNVGRELYADGYFADVSDLAGLKENFSVGTLENWSTADGTIFAVPIAAVSHGIYYNKTIFEENNLSIPKTFAEFLNVCEVLSAKGITPLANGIADNWDILECLFLSMVPNYVGGREQRLQYENGTKAYNDAAFVEAYSDLALLAKYLPSGFEATTYDDSQALFETQGAAMFVDGSWTLAVFVEDKLDFDWGVFAMPARSGNSVIVFHPDMGITMNADTKYPEEAKAFLEWLCTEDGAMTVSKALPLGFFPMINLPTTDIEEPHAAAFFALNNGRETDLRFVWPLADKLYTPMLEAVNNVLKGTMTPQQAADSIAAL